MLKSVYDCSVIELPRIENAKGNITPVHSGINLPFEIARIFYLYDIPGGEARGAHAHRHLLEKVDENFYFCGSLPIFVRSAPP